jgi:Mce-associated membrane protein
MRRIRAAIARIGSLRAAALGLAVAMLVLAGVFTWQTQTLNHDDALKNRAMIDANRQAGVIAAVDSGLRSVLSYSYLQPGATTKAADAALSEQAREQFDTLYASLQQRAPGQKLTLTATVQVAGVQQLSKDKATLLVFLDQASTREKDDQKTVSAAQLSVTAERRAQTWVITGLTPL